jgi:hypothetical protein
VDGLADEIPLKGLILIDARGYHGGMQQWAKDADAMLASQVTRLQKFVEGSSASK